MNNRSLIDIANSINIKNIRFIDENKKCKIHKLKNVIKKNKNYKLDIQINSNEYINVVNTILIPDMTLIVIEYLFNKNIIVNICRMRPFKDVFFILDDIMYNIYSACSPSSLNTHEIYISRWTCSERIENVKNSLYGILCCSCTKKHCFDVLDNKSIEHNNNQTETEELGLLYKIFLHLI